MTAGRPDPDQLDDLADAWRDERVSADVLGPEEGLELEPALNPSTVVGLHLPQKCQVRNPRHLKALLSATSAAGVELGRVRAWRSIRAAQLPD